MFITFSTERCRVSNNEQLLMLINFMKNEPIDQETLFCRLNYSHREYNHVNDLERLLFISLSHEEHHNDKKLICTNVVQISLIVCCSNVKFHSHHSVFCHRSCLNLLHIVFTQQFWHVFLMNYEASLSNLINFTPYIVVISTSC